MKLAFVINLPSDHIKELLLKVITSINVIWWSLRSAGVSSLHILRMAAVHNIICVRAIPA